MNLVKPWQRMRRLSPGAPAANLQHGVFSRRAREGRKGTDDIWSPDVSPPLASFALTNSIWGHQRGEAVELTRYPPQIGHVSMDPPHGETNIGVLIASIPKRHIRRFFSTAEAPQGSGREGLHSGRTPFWRGSLPTPGAARTRHRQHAEMPTELYGTTEGEKQRR